MKYLLPLIYNMKDNILLTIGISGIVLFIIIYLIFQYNIGGIPAWFLSLFENN